MGLYKCPRCELNYVREEDAVCDVCKRQGKGGRDEAEELQNMCAECGENKALLGQDICAYCLGERKRREKLDSLMERPSGDIDIDLELDEIDVPTNSDIPSEDLQEIHKEFGDNDEDELDEDEPEEEFDDFDSDFSDLEEFDAEDSFDDDEDELTDDDDY